MEHYVYILRSQRTGRYYRGMTNDLKRRLKEHMNDEEKSTANRGPWELVWWTRKVDRSEALILERKLKNYTSISRLEDFITRHPSEKTPK